MATRARKRVYLHSGGRLGRGGAEAVTGPSGLGRRALMEWSEGMSCGRLEEIFRKM